MKKSLSKQKVLSVTGYGERIRRAIWHRQSRTGGKLTLKLVGAVVATAIGRKEPFSAGTVSGWIEERSEPELAVLLALAQWAGINVGYLAFGEAGKEDAQLYELATETPENYYKDVTEKPKAAVSVKKQRGA